MTTSPTPDRVTAIYDAIDAFQRQFRTVGLQHAQIRASLAEHLDRALPAAVAVPPPATRAVLRWAADVIDAETRQAKADGVLEPDKYRPCRDAAAQLRRLADEATPVAAPSPPANEPGPDVAAAIASCPGYEMTPNPCRCPCEGCKHHCAAHDPDAAVSGPCVAGEQQNETPEDPARIDRLRPEFTEHSSIEAIDAQLRRSRAQERRWHIRTEWLISLRANRVAQKERGEWPAAGVRQDGAQP